MTPKPRELVRAYRTLSKLQRAIFPFYDQVQDSGGSPAWDGLVEGKRMLAVATSYLADTDETYQAAWETMVSE